MHLFEDCLGGVPVWLEEPEDEVRGFALISGQDGFVGGEVVEGLLEDHGQVVAVALLDLVFHGVDLG